jgi:hypothetical protein
MQKSYVVILDSSFLGQHYVLTISKTGNTIRLPGRKFYSERSLLEKDLRECLNNDDAEEAIKACRSVTARNTWTAQMLLTDACAAQLGWQR